MDNGMLYPRFTLSAVRTALEDTPVVVVQGARQVGKSTLVQMFTSESGTRMVTLDDPTTLRMAEDDPKAFVSLNPEGLLIIDEAQRAPGVILPLKANVDASRKPGRFLLTGSADLLKVKGVGDSLAGRAETVEMMPLSQGEFARRGTPEDFVSWILSGAKNRDFSPLDPQTIIQGGFPEVMARPRNRAKRWFESYITRLSDHDARELKDGGYADQLGAMLTYYASMGQAELVKAHVAQHLGVSETTVDTYLRTAKTMRLVYEYKSWNRVPQRRLIRRPKICLVDTGLSSALTGFTVPKAVSPGGREYYGSLVEQFVALELTKQQGWSTTPYELYHFRELDGLEVDLVVETEEGDLIAIEVKATTTPGSKHWGNLIKFRDRFPDRNITGVLLHAGDFASTLYGWLHVLPVPALWQM